MSDSEPTPSTWQTQWRISDASGAARKIVLKGHGSSGKDRQFIKVTENGIGFSKRPSIETIAVIEGDRSGVMFRAFQDPNRPTPMPVWVNDREVNEVPRLLRRGDRIAFATYKVVVEEVSGGEGVLSAPAPLMTGAVRPDLARPGYERGGYERPAHERPTHERPTMMVGADNKQMTMMVTSFVEKSLSSNSKTAQNIAIGISLLGVVGLVAGIYRNPDTGDTATTASGESAPPVRVSIVEPELTAAQRFPDQWWQAIKQNNIPEVERLVKMERDAEAARAGRMPASLVVGARWADLRGVDGKTSLIGAVEVESDALLQALLKNGVPVDDADDSGSTALLYAVVQGRASAVKLLLDAGANPDHRCADGKSVRDVARAAGRKDILALFSTR